MASECSKIDYLFLNIGHSKRISCMVKLTVHCAVRRRYPVELSVVFCQHVSFFFAQFDFKANRPLRHSVIRWMER